MNALFVVEKCLDPVILPGPDLRNVKHKDMGGNSEEYDDDDEEDLFNTISFQPRKPQVQARASGGERHIIWEHYIAVEEVTWDYAPHLKPTDRWERWRRGRRKNNRK